MLSKKETDKRFNRIEQRENLEYQIQKRKSKYLWEYKRLLTLAFPNDKSKLMFLVIWKLAWFDVLQTHCFFEELYKQVLSQGEKLVKKHKNEKQYKLLCKLYKQAKFIL